MLVRVDVSGGAGGVLLVSLSHQAAGFAPYRLDNCSCETLHLRCAARAALASCPCARDMQVTKQDSLGHWRLWANSFYFKMMRADATLNSIVSNFVISLLKHTLYRIFPVRQHIASTPHRSYKWYGKLIA